MTLFAPVIRNVGQRRRVRSIAHGLAMFAAVGMALAASACKSPREYRLDADQAAYENIATHQLRALGRLEPFTITPAAHTLRTRLMLDQTLPHAAAASFTSRAVEPIEQWPDESYLELSRDSPPAPWMRGDAITLSLLQTLQVAVRNSREYQDQKESVFLAALRLDLEEDRFSTTWQGLVSNGVTVDLAGDDVAAGMETTGGIGLTKRFKQGAVLATSLTIDLVRLLTMDRSSSMGLFADASISIPLLRGSGEFVVTEPLTQADRDLIYAIWNFERFKREFAVGIASDYLSVLQTLDQLDNVRDNYERLIISTRRARRLADAGRLPEIQVDQARQDELRARDRWISAQLSYQRQLDIFKITLGLPTDAYISLEPEELDKLADAASRRVLRDQALAEAEAEGDMDVLTEAEESQVPPAVDAPEVDIEFQVVPDADELADQSLVDGEGAGGGGDLIGSEAEAEVDAAFEAYERGVAYDAPVELRPPNREARGLYLELEESLALALALEHRLDLRIALGRIIDSQRGVAIAADNLRADLTLLGSTSAGGRRGLGSTRLDDADLRPEDSAYDVLLALDLPLERTAERNIYRSSLIGFEQSVRDLQSLEDRIKLDIRDRLRTLLQSRESLQTQAEAVRLAKRRVASTDMFLQAQCADIRDLLEAQEDLISAQNALTSALVNYRIAELQLQRDLGLLEVDEQGLWREWSPDDLADNL